VASRYDDLDASTGLEQGITEDLRAALTGRRCEVVHNGTNSGGRHAPGGKADIEVRDHPNKRLILVEVTRRKSSSADGEFIAVTDHLTKAIAAGGYDDYGVLYISPATSARLSSNFRDLWNRSRERDSLKGRVVAIDFATTQMMLDALAKAPSDLYPASRFGDLFARWADAEDDSLARLLVQQTLFPEDLKLAVELKAEVDDFAADRERTLKNELERIENDLRPRGVIGDDANRALVYLTFIRLYEERTQRNKGKPSRFTVDGFEAWRREQPQTTKNRYGDRMVEALLHEIAEDHDLKAADLLRDSHGVPHNLHPNVRDQFVVEKLLPVFDKYDFHAGRLDVLGAVFETLARRGEKDTRVGQFFTPQPVVDFCADIVPLKARDTVLDPAVGTARFLIKAMNVMVERAESQAEEKAVRSSRLLGVDIGAWVATIAKMNMYIHGDGKTNIKGANGLVLGDRSVFEGFPAGLSGRVDVVLTNPPLGETSHVVAVEDWIELAPSGENADPTVLLDRLGVVPMRVPEAAKLATAVADLAKAEKQISVLEDRLPDSLSLKALAGARRSRARLSGKVGDLSALIATGRVVREPVGEAMKGGALFLGAIADYLKPVRDQDAPAEWRGGWAAVVVDEAILNTPDYGFVREFIRDRFYVKAVVSLGRQAFVYLAHTDAKTSVLFVVRKPETGKAQSEPTFYAHAERVGYGRTGDWVGNDLQNVELSYREFARTVRDQYEGMWVDVDKAQRAAENLPGFGHAFHAMPDAGGTNRLDFYNARMVHLIRELHEQFGDLESLGDYLEVAEVEHPEPNRRGQYEFAQINRVEGTIRSKGVQSVNYSPRALWFVREGHLVVSGIDCVHGSVAVAGSDVDGLVMSGEMYAYRVKDPKAASAIYLQLLLRSPGARQLIEGMTTGTSNRTRLESAEQLLDLPIPPLPSLAEQRHAARKFEQSIASYRSARETQREVEGTVAELWQFAELTPDTEDEPTEFENFENAMKVILSVPKPD
jgi:type I restriction-modification system DNA methylase subunit